jgi:branched-chain amino acid transport system ATP-binding protein
MRRSGRLILGKRDNSMLQRKVMLETKDVSLFYENAIAINNVSLRCLEGQITGLFGSNSAGKSSLMYIISGIIVDMKKKEKMKGGERITWFGKMRYNKKDILNLKPSERAKEGIILCPERRRIFPESSALENLKIGGYLANKKQMKETLEYVFSIFPALQNKHILKRDGGFLSGGEQQMLAIGRALMAQPKLLLLDEPLLGLSPAMEKALVQAIKDINKQTGIAIFISEQYARPIFPIIDYGYVLENGSLVAEGTAQELMDNPDVMGAYFGGM